MLLYKIATFFYYFMPIIKKVYNTTNIYYKNLIYFKY